MWSSELQQTIIQSCKTAEFRLLEPLSRHTSFRIGGPAAVMVFPKTVEELKPLLQTASAHGITPYILGAGTNVLAPDEGLQAIVICLKDALTSIRLLDKTRMEVFAGESMAKAAVFAKNHALTGLDCPGCGMTRAAYLLMHGHPGLALRQNPFIVVIPVVAYMGIAELSPYLFGRKLKQVPVAPWMLIVLGVLVAVYTVAKNLPKFF